MTEVFHVDSYEEMNSIHAQHGDIVNLPMGSFIAISKTKVALTPIDCGAIRDSRIIQEYRCESYEGLRSIKYKPSFPKVKGRGGKFKKY